METPRLTAQEFDHLIGGTNLKEPAISVARAVLVDGESKANAAARFNLSKQRAGQVCDRVLAQRARGGRVSASHFINRHEAKAIQKALKRSGFTATQADCIGYVDEVVVRLAKSDSQQSEIEEIISEILRPESAAPPEVASA